MGRAHGVGHRSFLEDFECSNFWSIRARLGLDYGTLRLKLAVLINRSRWPKLAVITWYRLLGAAKVGRGVSNKHKHVGMSCSDDDGGGCLMR